MLSRQGDGSDTITSRQCHLRCCLDDGLLPPLVASYRMGRRGACRCNASSNSVPLRPTN